MKRGDIKQQCIKSKKKKGSRNSNKERWTDEKSIDQKTGLACLALGETNSSSSVSIKNIVYGVCLSVYLCPSCSPPSNA